MITDDALLKLTREDKLRKRLGDKERGGLGDKE